MPVEHYENFPVASWLLPPALRPQVEAIYDAFRQDVVKKRYATFDELMDYCRRSADPVGAAAR